MGMELIYTCLRELRTEDYNSEHPSYFLLLALLIVLFYVVFRFILGSVYKFWRYYSIGIEMFAKRMFHSWKNGGVKRKQFLS